MLFLMLFAVTVAILHITDADIVMVRIEDMSAMAGAVHPGMTPELIIFDCDGVPMTRLPSFDREMGNIGCGSAFTLYQA